MVSSSITDLRTLGLPAIMDFGFRFGLNREQCSYFHEIVQAGPAEHYIADITFVVLPAPKTPVWRLLRESSGAVPKLRDPTRTQNPDDAQSHRAQHSFEKKYTTSLPKPAATSVQDTTSSTQNHTVAHTLPPTITVPQPPAPTAPTPKEAPKPFIIPSLAPAPAPIKISPPAPIAVPALPILPFLKPNVVDERKPEPTKVATSVFASRHLPVNTSDVSIKAPSLPPPSIFGQPKVVPIVPTPEDSDEMDCTPIPEVSEDYDMDAAPENYPMDSTYGYTSSWNPGPWNSISDWAMQDAFSPPVEPQDVVIASPPQNAFWQIPIREEASVNTSQVNTGFSWPMSSFAQSFPNPEPQPTVAAPIPKRWDAGTSTFPPSSFSPQPDAPPAPRLSTHKLPSPPPAPVKDTHHSSGDDDGNDDDHPEDPRDAPKVAIHPQSAAVTNFLDSVARPLNLPVARSLLEPGPRYELHQSPPPRAVQPEEDASPQPSTLTVPRIFVSDSANLESYESYERDEHGTHEESYPREGTRDDYAPPPFEREATGPLNEEEHQPPSIVVHPEYDAQPLLIRVQTESDPSSPEILRQFEPPVFAYQSTEPLDEGEDLPPSVFVDLDTLVPFERESTEPLDESEQQPPAVFLTGDEDQPAPAFEREGTEPLDESEQRPPAAFLDVDEEQPAPVFEREGTEPLDESEQQPPAVFLDVDEQQPPAPFQRESTEPLDESEQRPPALFLDVDDEPPAPPFEREGTEPLDESEQQPPAVFLPADNDQAVLSGTEEQGTISPLSEPLPEPPFVATQAGPSRSSRREDRRKRITRGRDHATTKAAIIAAAKTSRANLKKGKEAGKVLAPAQLRQQKRAGILRSRVVGSTRMEDEEQRRQDHTSRRAALRAALSGARHSVSPPEHGLARAAGIRLPVTGSLGRSLPPRMRSASDPTSAVAGMRRRRASDDEGDRDSERIERLEPPKRQRQVRFDNSDKGKGRADEMDDDEEDRHSERLERSDPPKRRKWRGPIDKGKGKATETDDNNNNGGGGDPQSGGAPQAEERLFFRLPSLRKVKAIQAYEKRMYEQKKRERKARRDMRAREEMQAHMAPPPASTSGSSSLAAGHFLQGSTQNSTHSLPPRQPSAAMQAQVASGLLVFGTDTIPERDNFTFSRPRVLGQAAVLPQLPTTQTQSQQPLGISPFVDQSSSNIAGPSSMPYPQNPAFPQLPTTETHPQPPFGTPLLETIPVDPSSSNVAGPSFVPRSLTSTQSTPLVFDPSSFGLSSSSVQAGPSSLGLSFVPASVNTSTHSPPASSSPEQPENTANFDFSDLSNVLRDPGSPPPP